MIWKGKTTGFWICVEYLEDNSINPILANIGCVVLLSIFDVLWGSKYESIDLKTRIEDLENNGITLIPANEGGVVLLSNSNMYWKLKYKGIQ